MATKKTGPAAGVKIVRGRESPRISVRFGASEWKELAAAEKESGQPITRILRMGVEHLGDVARARRKTLGQYVAERAREEKA
jgi:hypothetical protein